MTNQFFELLNPNTYFGFFSQNPCESYLPVKIEFLSSLEELCLQGNLESLKSIVFNQDHIKNESKFLNGILLSIRFNHLDVFKYLINLDNSKEIIQRHIKEIRNFILSEGKIFFLSNLEALFLENNQESSLSPKHDLAQGSINIAFEELWTYYHSQLRAHSLIDHIKAIRKKLSIYCQDNRAYCMESLPLDLESFRFMSKKYNPSEQQTILKAYKKNSLHRAWRLLNPDDEWFENSIENKLAKELLKHQWLIVLLWLASNDSFVLTPNNSIMTTEERVKIFFERLALLHNEIDIRKQLLLCVLAHPLTKLLTKDILMLEQEKFIKKNLTELINALSLDSLQQLLQELKTNPNHQNRIESQLKFNESHFLCFHEEMSLKWKNQWTKNNIMQEYSKSILLHSSHLFAEHQQVILDTIQQSCLVEQSRIQSLGFFQSSKIKSTNPITKDFLLPLS